MTRVEELLILLQEAIKVQAGVTRPRIDIGIFPTSEPGGIDLVRALDIAENLITVTSHTPKKSPEGAKWIETDFDNRIQLTVFYQ